MSHLSLSLMSRLNKTESAVFKLWTLYFQMMSFADRYNNITSWYRHTLNEPRQANLCLRAFRHDKLQLRMPSHSEGPGIWFSVWRFLFIHCLYERASEGSGETARMRRLAWTFAARIGNKYQIRLARSIFSVKLCVSGRNTLLKQQQLYIR